MPNRTEQERERRADEMFTDRIITGSMYCGSCGYDLYKLPYIHQCPECGQPYNARPLVMKGVFVPSMVDPPVRELAFGALFVIGAGLLIASGIRPPDIWRLVFGLILALAGALELAEAWVKSRRYLAAIRIQRRIERERE